ncbi:MAG: hypothetical protein RIR83_1686, partial [Pseudomonadota bacterium]
EQRRQHDEPGTERRHHAQRDRRGKMKRRQRWPNMQKH